MTLSISKKNHRRHKKPLRQPKMTKKYPHLIRFSHKCCKPTKSTSYNKIPRLKVLRFRSAQGWVYLMMKINRSLALSTWTMNKLWHASVKKRLKSRSKRDVTRRKPISKSRFRSMLSKTTKVRAITRLQGSLRFIPCQVANLKSKRKLSLLARSEAKMQLWEEREAQKLT